MIIKVFLSTARLPFLRKGQRSVRRAVARTVSWPEKKPQRYIFCVSTLGKSRTSSLEKANIEGQINLNGKRLIR